jgi:hypothetical protein
MGADVVVVAGVVRRDELMMRRCGRRACEKIEVAGPEGSLLLKPKRDEVRHSVAKGQEECYLEFEESP